jgi:putative ABC transport system substrate-binding protein
MTAFIGRREFITLLGGAVVAWPLRARAQQSGERLRRIGCLMLYNESDPAGQSRAMAFQEGLEKLGWSIGRNLVIDLHWGIGDAGWIRSATMELLMRSPDLILANGGQAVPPVQQASRSVPIIFIGGSDPVAEGYVQSLGHPGSNSTGFTTLEPSVGAKLLGLLKEIAPHVVRAVLIFNPDNAGSLRLSGAAEAAAQQFDIEVIVVPVQTAQDIEALFTKHAGRPAIGLIVPPDPLINSHRRLIVGLAERHRIPAMYALRAATAEGGLASYGVDVLDLFRKAAVYADRILRGEKPGDLPVQQPTKFELVINLNTAKKLNIEVPVHLQQLADEVIE